MNKILSTFRWPAITLIFPEYLFLLVPDKMEETPLCYTGRLNNWTTFHKKWTTTFIDILKACTKDKMDLPHCISLLVHQRNALAHWRPKLFWAGLFCGRPRTPSHTHFWHPAPPRCDNLTPPVGLFLQTETPPLRFLKLLFVSFCWSLLGTHFPVLFKQVENLFGSNNHAIRIGKIGGHKWMRSGAHLAQQKPARGESVQLPHVGISSVRERKLGKEQKDSENAANALTWRLRLHRTTNLMHFETFVGIGQSVRFIGESSWVTTAVVYVRRKTRGRVRQVCRGACLMPGASRISYWPKSLPWYFHSKWKNPPYFTKTQFVFV